MRLCFWLPCILLPFLAGCGQETREGQKNASYFDLKSYTAQEAERLQAANPKVSKTAGIDDSKETKILRITNWAKELSPLTDADINKAAWKGLFSAEKKGNEVIYRSDNEKVPVKLVSIRYKNAKPEKILVLISKKNMLYSSADSLVYYPDSLYQIRKAQHILLLPAREYSVSIKFK